MNEKERIASEEAEKRLKAALTAKREPAASTSRVGSPAIGDSAPQSESAREGKAPTQGEDVAMEGTETSIPAQPEVGPSVIDFTPYQRCR